jgi:hypothetical protein
LLARETSAPDAPAACESVTVHVDADPELMLAGPHDADVSTGTVGAERITDAVRETPLRLAVITAVPPVKMVPPRIPNVLLADPAGMVTDAGNVSRIELLDSVTATPPVPAAAESVTVQVNVAPDSKPVAGHETELSVGPSRRSRSRKLHRGHPVDVGHYLPTEPAVFAPSVRIVEATP